MNDYRQTYAVKIPRLLAFLRKTGRLIEGYFDTLVEDMGYRRFKCETECGQIIRYRHTMINGITGDELKVGCCCAAALESLNYGTDCYEKYYEIIQEIQKIESNLKGQERKRVKQFKKFCEEVKPCKNNQNYYYRINDVNETIFINITKKGLFNVNFTKAQNSYKSLNNVLIRTTFKGEPIKDLKTASWVAFCGINPKNKITERKIPRGIRKESLEIKEIKL